MVYIKSKDGKTLMPTKRYGKVRRLLKDKKAKVLKVSPFFQIQLLYDTSEFTQPTTLKVDSGYKHIGISAVNETKELISIDATLLQGMKERLEERASYRRTRRGRKRYRKPRFLNRKRNNGWLAPSIQHKLDSHEKLCNLVKDLVPVKDSVVEIGTFDPHKLKNPDVEGKEYQEGPQKGFFNVREYVLYRDNHECQHPECIEKRKQKQQKAKEKGEKLKEEKVILDVHHFKFCTGRKTDNPSELITLCSKHHSPKNHQPGGLLYGWMPVVSKILKEAAFMNSVRIQLAEKLNARKNYGWVTKCNRIDKGLEKSHANDAFCIEVAGSQERAETVYLQQVRRNNRSLEKFYDAKYIDGRDGSKSTGKKLFNGRTKRNKNTNSENLHKYRLKKVSKGRRAIRKQRYFYQPNDMVKYEGCIFTVKGTHSNGKRVILKENEKSIKVGDLKPYRFGNGFIKVLA